MYVIRGILKVSLRGSSSFRHRAHALRLGLFGASGVLRGPGKLQSDHNCTLIITWPSLLKGLLNAYNYSYAL